MLSVCPGCLQKNPYDGNFARDCDIFVRIHNGKTKPERSGKSVMTTHVFIVNEQSFRVHLAYMFAGTGSGDKTVDFNGSAHSSISAAQTENGLIAMMADFSRVRVDDYVIFYVQASEEKEGKFYGIYQIASDPFLEPDGRYLHEELGKSLTFRVLIKPYEVFAEGVSEWEALDDIKGVEAPCQMLWSLIYRKLKGNRGNTMLMPHEADRLFSLIRSKNNCKALNGNSFTYENGRQVENMLQTEEYAGKTRTAFDILPRLIYKKRNGKAYEAHLQMYLVQHIGRDPILDRVLKADCKSIEWLGNEVSCGVGMQRIDVMFSRKTEENTKEIVPVELKAVPASEDNVRQLSRYIDWIEQYYIPNRPGIIRPVLICPKSELGQKTIDAFRAFNAKSNGRYLPLEYIEFTDDGEALKFDNVMYGL